MTTIETLYGIGDVVFGVRTLTARRRPPCPLCDGSGRVALAIADRSATCPDCHGRRYDQDDAHAATQQRATIQRLTVGAVRWEDRAGASYMAEETGVGSGTSWAEDRLYGTYAGALAACKDAVVVFAHLAVDAPHVQTIIRGEADVEDWR